MPKPPPADSPFWKLFHLGTRVNLVLFRATKGKVGGRMGTSPILLLHHVGRRSGEARVSPLNYLDDAPDLVVVASKGGVDAHPAWFHNLMAMDSTEVELPGGERRRVRPRVAEGAERDALWPRLVEMYKPYAEYATYTERRIPVVVLEPA
ncbi:MAG: nitroreductase family deazaflavin-dependent oxidoreductase [Pseudonocardia sp.]|nr:nitroreductase family deazaflavin-dependent oxidoreductase [Pseudonocardia sp.]